MRIESFQCWACDEPKHFTVIAWHQIKPGQMELACDHCWAILRDAQSKRKEPVAA